MNERERVICAIKHEKTDIIPYNIQFTVEERKIMADFYGDAGFEAKIGNHIDFIDIRPPKTEIKPGFVRDEFGVVLNKTIDKDFGLVEEYLVDAQSVDSFKFPDPDDPSFFEGLRAYNPCGKFFVAKFSHVFFERAWMLYGMENLMADMLLRPDTVHRLLDRILEHFLALLENIRTFDFVDCVYFGDDWGQQRGLIMGPGMWREFIKPRLKILFGRAKEMEKYVYIHTCGDIVSILPEIIEVGVDIYDPFQPEAFDVFELKKQFGKEITFLGGVSLQKVLPFGSVMDVRNEVNLKLKELGQGGGYICAPSHTVTKDVPPENLDEMIRVLMNQ